MKGTNKEIYVSNDRYSYKMDALTEMGNIAAAHAATALSKLLGDDILIDVPESHLYRVEDIPQSLSHLSDQVAVIQVDVDTEERGIILFVFPYDNAITLSNMFLKKNNVTSRKIEDDDREAMCEIGNICACAYLNAISKFLDVTLIPSPPGLAVDMPEAIFQFPASLMGEQSNYAIIIETKFTHNNETFPGMILFVLDNRSQELFIDRILSKIN